MADEDQKKRTHINASDAISEGELDDKHTPPGLTGEEAATVLDERLEDLLPETTLEGYKVEDLEGDSDAHREALNTLRETGDPDAAVDALTSNPELTREGEDGERVEVSVQEGEPVPFEELSEELGLDADRVTVKVKVQGEEQEISLKDALSGFSRTEDYSRKTQRLAEKRKKLDQTLQEQQERLGLLAGAMEDQLNPYQRQTIKQTINRVRAQQDQLRQQTIQEEVIPREIEKLTERLGVESQEEMEQAARRIGETAIDHYDFRPEELESVLDHRLLAIAHDAAKYHELKARQEEARETAEKNRKRGSRTLKPGSSSKKSSNNEFERAIRDLRTPGRRPDVDKAADAILAGGLL